MKYPIGIQGFDQMREEDCVYIFEFKMDGSADEALQQIETKGYAQPYLNDLRQVIHIGMNFSSESRTIAEWKVSL